MFQCWEVVFEREEMTVELMKGHFLKRIHSHAEAKLVSSEKKTTERCITKNLNKRTTKFLYECACFYICTELEKADSIHFYTSLTRAHTSGHTRVYSGVYRKVVCIVLCAGTPEDLLATLLWQSSLATFVALCAISHGVF